MVRKLIPPLLSLLLVVPTAASALGLGEVKLHSALNQNLKADIELLSVEPTDAESLEISMASVETFAKLGLNRPSVLMYVTFEVKQRANGSYFVRATSKNAIREPFLDFLVEAKWPSGRVLREYTLLLDPPTRHAEMSSQVAPATTGQQPQPAAPAATETVQPVTPVRTQPEAAVATPMPREEKVTYYPSQPTAQPGGMSYGPVKGGDTLWEIALKMRPNRDISVHRMMLALLKANPHAFVDNNINRLKKGFVLRVDDPALYTAMSQAEAVREVARQNRIWQDYRAAVAAKAAKRKGVAAKDSPSRSTASRKSEPKLKLVAPNGKQRGSGAGAGDANSAELEEQLMLAMESSAAHSKENEELQGRVDDLEAQVQDMQRLLSLKDTDMATLQKQLREQGKAVSLPSEQEQAANDETEVKPKSEAEEKPATDVKSDDAKAATEQQKPEASKSADANATENKPVPVKPKSAKPAQKPKAKPKPRVKPQPQPEPSFVDMLLGDQMMMMAGGGVIVMLLLLGLVISRRRSKGGFQESILSGGSSSMLNAGDDEGTRSETSFLSDLAISGMGGGTISTDEGEVDPITEADVFMAYGRYQQAEEVLQKALEGNPDRPEVTGKLFEVYFNTREKDKFEELASTSATSLQENEEVWASVVTMGKQICPENPLFAVADDSAVEASAPAAPAEPISDDVLDIGLDLDELSAEMESEGGTDDDGLGLELDSTPAETESAAPGEAAGDLDFDLDFGGDDDTTAPAAEASSDVGELDFDLGDIGDSDKPASAEAATDTNGDLDLGDLDFGDISDSSDTVGQDEPASMGLADLGGGSGEDGLSELTSKSDDGGASDDDTFGDGDEISTKLDLAQAYIEMGDGEGARSMLDEVVVQGNAQQKQQAESLLSRI